MPISLHPFFSALLLILASLLADSSSKSMPLNLISRLLLVLMISLMSESNFRFCSCSRILINYFFMMSSFFSIRMATAMKFMY